MIFTANELIVILFSLEDRILLNLNGLPAERTDFAYAENGSALAGQIAVQAAIMEDVERATFELYHLAGVLEGQETDGALPGLP